MKKTMLAAALAAATFSGALDAQPVSEETLKEAARLRDLALENDSAYAFLEGLTTEVGPRLAGTEQEHKAVGWAIERLTKMGFDKVYTEDFPLTVWRRLHESAAVVGKSAQPLAITALGGSVSTPQGGLTGEIVMFATYEDLVAADPADVNGKIAFIARKMERFRDGRGYGVAGIARRQGALVAAEKGAIALMIRSIGTDSHRMPHTGQMQRAGDQQAPIAAVALSNPDADQLERLLKRGAVEVSLDVQTRSETGITQNVIAEVTGRERPDEFVVIGGHLDSWDLGTGAVDDGAGVAITSAAADFIADHATQRPRRSIRVVLFGAEEQGLTGARAYADAHASSIDKLIIGAESDFGAGPVWGFASNTGTNAAPALDALAGLLGPLGVVRVATPAYGGPDVGQLRLKGMPVVDLKQDGTDYFDLHHTPDDTLDKVDPADMRQNLAAWVSFVFLAAEWPGSFR